MRAGLVDGRDGSAASPVSLSDESCRSSCSASRETEMSEPTSTARAPLRRPPSKAGSPGLVMVLTSVCPIVVRDSSAIPRTAGRAWPPCLVLAFARVAGGRSGRGRRGGAEGCREATGRCSGAPVTGNGLRPSSEAISATHPRIEAVDFTPQQPAGCAHAHAPPAPSPRPPW
jgi:hypothetical protein